jgi:cobalt-zinc-cadmium efflux system membrane fusion protein
LPGWLSPGSWAMCVLSVGCLWGRQPTDAWLGEWRELVAARGVRRAIPLRVTADTGPMLCRLPRGYELLVPAPLWRGLAPRERVCILRHELAHYERGDVWKSLAARVLALPHWFNPLAWWAVRRFDEAAEWACDRAATADEPATAYAKALLRLGEAAGRHPSYSPAARGRTLSRRIRRVLARTPQEDSIAKKTLFAVAALLIGAAALVRVELVAKEPAEDEPTTAEVGPRADFAPPAGARDVDAADKPTTPRLSLHETAVGRLPMGLLGLAAEKGGKLHLTADDLAARGLHIAIAKPAGTEPLVLRGSTALDPQRLMHVRPRLAGEVGVIAEIQPARNEKMRQLTIFDQVTKGQVLATLWSKELGEKKSELVEALSELRLDQKASDRIKDLTARGAVAEQALREAERQVETGKLAVARAERTLRSWQVSDEEIKRVKSAVEDQNAAKKDPAENAAWGRIDIVAPIDGSIVERNANVGDIVDTSYDLFKIADLSQLAVYAHVYEEDIPALQSVPRDRRRWQIRVPSAPAAEPIDGKFDAIGDLIDPTEHMALVHGSVQNADGRLKAGQFITATIELPADPTLVAIPATAVVDDGATSTIFVQGEGEDMEFKRRKISIAKRTSSAALVRGEPPAQERAAGVEGVKVGEKLLALAPVDERTEQRATSEDTIVQPPTKDPLVDTARQAYDGALKAYESGRGGLEAVSVWSTRWMAAEESASGNSALRVAAARACRPNARRARQGQGLV